MRYDFVIEPSCHEMMLKASKKNKLLEEVLKKKIEEITYFPEHYKPLSYNLVGERRVHILKCFILKFTVDTEKRLVTFIFFGHHDEAYKR